MVNGIFRQMLLGCAAMVLWLNGSGEAAGPPDILGVQLGMPARDAHAKLQAQLPKNKIAVDSTNLPTIDKPVIVSFGSTPSEQLMMGMEGDQVRVNVTLPPNKQAVWRIDRQHYFPDKGIPKTTLLASLREKYGKETLTNVQQGKPATDDNHILNLLWLFDEQGRPAPLPSSPGLTNTLTLASCISLGDNENLGLIEVYADLYKGQNPQNDWCYNSYTAVFVGVSESNRPELYNQMRLVAVSLPAVLRASQATLKWKKEIAESQHKQDIEKAKQQEKPKL
jgi:hypothetical protein